MLVYRMEIALADRKGNPDQQPPNCRAGRPCPYLRETSSNTDMDGETYDCARCGKHYRLYYDEMR